MFIHARIRYSIFLIIPLILLILSPAVSLADADRIFKENSKAVVVVTAYDQKGNAISQGSGFIVRADGAVVTNYHVISRARDIKVKTGDKVLDVEGLIFTDKENNLVILKVKAKNMPVVTFGNIGKANLDEGVYVMTSSEISYMSFIKEEIGQKREIFFDIKTMNSMPESSGSPVFNRNGEVIGVVVSPFIEGTWFFAIPVDLIKDKVGSKKVTAIKEAGLEDFEKTAGYWMIHHSHGINHMTSGRHKEAIEAFKQVIRILPDYARVYLELGKNYRGLGMYKEAMEAYKQAVRINPDDAYAYFRLSQAYNDLGRHKEAWEASKQTIRIEPDDFWGHYEIGLNYLQSGMYKEAIDECKQAIRINPDNAKAHFWLGFAYSRLFMFKEAKDALMQAINIEPDDAEAHYWLGAVYITLNDRGSALEQYKILKSLDPEKANELFNLIYE